MDVRGHARDYDRWAQKGALGWSYDDVLPYFKRVERWEDGEAESPARLHGWLSSREGVREYRFDTQPVANGGVKQDGGMFAAINYARMARLRKPRFSPPLPAIPWTLLSRTRPPGARRC